MNLNRDCLYLIVDEIYDLEMIYKASKLFNFLNKEKVIRSTKKVNKKIINDCKSKVHFYYTRNKTEVYVSPNRQRLCIIHYDDYVSLYANFFDISGTEIREITIDKTDNGYYMPDLPESHYDGCISFPDCGWITDDIFLWGIIDEWCFEHNMSFWEMMEQGITLPDDPDPFTPISFWNEAQLLSIQHVIYDNKQNKMIGTVIKDYRDEHVKYLPKNSDRTNRKHPSFNIT